MATAELVLLTPLALVVLGFLVVAGRLSTTSADVAAASRDAARAASLAQSYPEAVVAANDTAAASLGAQDVTCRTLAVTVGDPALFIPGGEVSVTLSCEVDLSDVAVPGVPGSRPVAATSVEVIDSFRSMG
ncbi:MAG: pilus assembly protein [Actinobacteria bacterium]|nr:pilus assembly protein [Actinomycetota bacterium]